MAAYLLLAAIASRVLHGIVLYAVLFLYGAFALLTLSAARTRR